MHAFNTFIKLIHHITCTEGSLLCSSCTVKTGVHSVMTRLRLYYFRKDLQVPKGTQNRKFLPVNILNHIKFVHTRQPGHSGHDMIHINMPLLGNVLIEMTVVMYLPQEYLHIRSRAVTLDYPW